jgi:hypothetical protein
MHRPAQVGEHVFGLLLLPSREVDAHSPDLLATSQGAVVATHPRLHGFLRTAEILVIADIPIRPQGQLRHAICGGAGRAGATRVDQNDC